MPRESRMETAFIVNQRHKIEKRPLQLGMEYNYKATLRDVCSPPLSGTNMTYHEIECQDFQKLRIGQGSTRKIQRLLFAVVV